MMGELAKRLGLTTRNIELHPFEGDNDADAEAEKKAEIEANIYIDPMNKFLKNSESGQVDLTIHS